MARKKLTKTEQSVSAPHTTSKRGKHLADRDRTKGRRRADKKTPAISTRKGNARKGALVGSRLAYDDTPSKKRKAKASKPKASKSSKPKGKSKGKKETIKLGGKTIKFKKGALHRALKFSGTFTKSEISRLSKVDNGKSFKFKGNSFKMTALMKRRVGLAKAMMGLKKK